MNTIDIAITAFDRGLRILTGVATNQQRPNPANHIKAQSTLSPDEEKHAAGLMRVDHTGEVCAQALYFGQALLARDQALRQHLLQAAEEENDHLQWCQQRLAELNDHSSRLNAFWYLHSFLLGLFASSMGDKFSLGFLIETERQVAKHIDAHLQQLPIADHRSKAILEQMRVDEQEHANNARIAGGIELPKPIRLGMRLLSKMMTTTVYYW